MSSLPTKGQAKSFNTLALELSHHQRKVPAVEFAHESANLRASASLPDPDEIYRVVNQRAAIVEQRVNAKR